MMDTNVVVTSGQITDELARQFAGRVLDHLGLSHHLTRRWGEEEKVGVRGQGSGVREK